MRIGSGETIESVDKFIASHERFIANLKEGKARSAYKYRLDKVRKLIIEQNGPEKD